MESKELRKVEVDVLIMESMIPCFRKASKTLVEITFLKILYDA